MNTQISVQLIDSMGSDLSVANAARVSFAKKSFGESIEYDLFRDDPEVIKASVAKYKAEGWVITSDVDDWKITICKPTMGDAKLIRYLAKHKHLSPFNHTFVTFHVSAPVYVARQLVKHEYMPWNEVSKRYVDDTPELYEPEWRSRSVDKKQGSGGPMEISLDSEMLYHATCRNALTTYERMIQEGVSPEQARSILPQNMMTQWYWSGTVGAVSKMCRLRCKEDTQYESRLVANQIREMMGKLYPVSWAALMKVETDD
jgi:thymidylate synthase (FAD)